MRDYLTQTWGGEQLLKKYSLDQEGTWQIFGEDPNCDFGGHHHQPLLATVTGRLEDVVKKGTELDGFWQWGAGGDFRLLEITPVDRIPVQPPDPYFRIGQLEGAIKGALPYFEESVTEWGNTLSGSEMWRIREACQVIAKLKELIQP